MSASMMPTARAFPVTFGGKNYDLQKFLRDHPGGVNTLENYKGKSVYNAMQKFGHSFSAYHMLNDLKINGEVKDSNLSGEVSANGRIITKGEVDKDAEEIAFLEELESRLDWSQPILSQLHQIAPHYQRWVNTSVYRKCRIFKNPLMERMTYTPWYVVPAFWIPVLLCMTWIQFVETVSDCNDLQCPPRLSILEFIYHIACGVILWTFLEYVLHRWVFHLDPGTSIIRIKMHFLLHGIHHKVPFDSSRLVFPPVPAMVLTAIIYTPLSFILTYGRLKLIGALCGYLCYDMIHYYIHYGSPVDSSYLYSMKRYHSNHHFVNHDKAFGISNKFWDIVFRTCVKVKKLTFSLRWY